MSFKQFPQTAFSWFLRTVMLPVTLVGNTIMSLKNNERKDDESCCSSKLSKIIISLSITLAVLSILTAIINRIKENNCDCDDECCDDECCCDDDCDEECCDDDECCEEEPAADKEDRKPVEQAGLINIFICRCKPRNSNHKHLNHNVEEEDDDE